MWVLLDIGGTLWRTESVTGISRRKWNKAGGMNTFHRVSCVEPPFYNNDQSGKECWQIGSTRIKSTE